MKFLGTIINIKDNGSLALTDYPSGLAGLKLPAKVQVGFSLSSSTPFTIVNYEITKKRLIINFENINSYERGEKFKEMGIFAETDILLFENNNDYFVSDLIGCTVFDNDTNEIIGELTDVLNMPANDVWLIKTEKGELPVPAVEEIIREVDMTNMKIYIKMIDGLWDLIE